MISVGLDVGSRTIALMVLNGAAPDSRVVDTGVRPLQRCQQLLNDVSYQHLTVTGYGRYLVAPALDGEVVSEISAYASGARYLYPDCRTVIDIGGQDSKVISLSDSGTVFKFEMNDRCAAGTGRFLELMADTLEVTIEEFGELALKATKTVSLNSLCTVFAESEVVSLIARGEESSAIALALHETITTRIANMARRIGIREKVVLAGGVAMNRCIQTLLGRKLGVGLVIPEEPQTVGALGAALLTKAGAKEQRAV